MKLSVIIPCCNAEHTIARQLDALARQEWTEPWEVLIADNGSTDRTVTVAQRYVDRLPDLRIVDASKKKGASYARNIAVLASRGESLAFCDADDEVGDGWIATMGAAVARHDFVACRIDTGKLNPPWVQQVYGPHPQRNRLQQTWYTPYLTHAGGGSIAVKRCVHDAVGGFDESLMRVMDTDYCFKIQLAGTPLVFIPEAVVHISLRSNAKDIARQGRLWAMHQALVYKRYRPSGTREYGRWLGYAESCFALLARVLWLRNKSDWAKWTCRLAQHVGRLQGSLKYGVPPV
jgi:glycosyltransferase involved in cell wall biosynthesis